MLDRPAVEGQSDWQSVVHDVGVSLLVRGRWEEWTLVWAALAGGRRRDASWRHPPRRGCQHSREQHCDAESTAKPPTLRGLRLSQVVTFHSPASLRAKPATGAAD